MNINHLAEQLKDVPQNRLVGYAQNPNSVVPQFLALAEIQRRKTLEAGAQQKPQSTVAEDVLASAQPMMQAEETGVAQLPTGSLYQNDETFSAANGGIVAFAGGGIYDTEAAEGQESEAEEMARLYPEASFMDRIKSGLSNSYIGQKAARAMEKERPTQLEAKTGGGHKYESAVLEEAKRQGVDPKLALHVLYKETGNLANPESAKSRSGALGVMQLMPKTAHGLGVNPNVPEENIAGGIRYLKQMSDKYQDPRLAAAAYNAGPGRLDKALKSKGGIENLPNETRKYIVGLAEGGIAHYADGDLVEARKRREDALNALTKNMPDMPEDYAGSLTDYLSDPKRASAYEKNQKEREIARKAIIYNNPLPAVNRDILNPSASMKRDAAKPSQSEWDDNTKKLPVMQSPEPSAAPAPTPDQAVTKSQLENTSAPAALAPEDPFAKLGELLAKKEAGLGKEREQNKYLGMLTAGLGMMGGKSQYALENIGAGGQQGVATYGALNKQTSDMEKDILSGQLGMAKYKSAAEAQKAHNDAVLKQRQLEFTGRDQDRDIQLANAFEAQQIKALDARYKGMMGWGVDPKLTAAYERDKAAIYNDPRYKALVKQAYPGMDMSPLPSSATIPAQAIAALKKDPKLKDQFEAKFGAGSAATYLGQ